MSFQQVSKEGLNLEYKIQILSDDIEVRNSERYDELKGQANISGFRPGKVPANYISQKYGPAITQETIEKLLRSEVDDLIHNENLQITSQPKIDVKEYTPGIDLECSFSCEIFPDVKVDELEFSKLKLTDYQITISDADIDKHINNIAKKHGEKISYEKADHKAKKGDFVTINYSGSIDGEKFEGGTAENTEIELGSKSMIPGFEEKIIGMKKGSKETIKVKFPKKYHAIKLQKKDAEFAIEVLDIQYTGDIKLDDELAKKLGKESIAECRKEAGKALEQMLDGQKQNKLKEELFNYIEEKIQIELPKSLVEKEHDQLVQKYLQDQGFKNAEEAQENDKKDFEKEQKEHDKLANRRIKVGIVLAEISKQENINVTENEVLAKFESEIMQYPEEIRNNLLSYYQTNPGAMEHLKAPIIEDKVVTFLKEKGVIKTKKVSYEQFKKIYEN
jgi:trigger factor